MSAPFGRFALTMDDITKLIRGTFETFIDPRTPVDADRKLTMRTD